MTWANPDLRRGVRVDSQYSMLDGTSPTQLFMQRRQRILIVSCYACMPGAGRPTATAVRIDPVHQAEELIDPTGIVQPAG